MFIAHLSAGYILTEILQRNFNTSKYFLFGLIASVLPDVDIFYFYLVDNKQYLHHDYWIHIPFYWLVMGFVVFGLVYFLKKRDYFIMSSIFFVNIFLHLFLDTIVGKIVWLFPFKKEAFSFFEVPAVYDIWIYNFVFHWTFILEILIVLLALYVFLKMKFYVKY